MSEIGKSQTSLYLLSALIGGVVGVISTNYILILVPSLRPPDSAGSEPLVGLYCLAVILGVVLGIVLGKIGYAIKPRVWASIIGAALGGALVSMMCLAPTVVSEGLSKFRLEQSYPEPKPIPTLAATFQELASGEYIESCAVNSDGSRLALGSNNQITLWDLDNHKQLGKFPFDYDNRILALSPDSLTLAHGYPEGVTLWDVKTGEELAQLEGNGIGSLVFSPDGRLLAWIESMEGIVLWDPLVKEKLTRIKVPSISSLAFSPNSKLIAASNYDGQISLWDISILKEVGKLQEASGVFSLAFSPDGSRLAAGINDLDKAGIGLWDVDSRTRLAGTQAPTGSWNVAFSSDGQKLTSSGDSGVVWKEVVSPDDLKLETREVMGADLYLWDANSLEPLGSLSGPATDSSEAFILPDGRVLACYWDENSPDSIGIWTIESP